MTRCQCIHDVFREYDANTGFQCDGTNQCWIGDVGLFTTSEGDKHYCVFHAPKDLDPTGRTDWGLSVRPQRQAEILQHLLSEWRSVNAKMKETGQPAVAFVLPGLRCGGLDLRVQEFPGAVRLDDAEFTTDVWLEQASFEDWAEFSGATFLGEARLDGVTFHRTAIFVGAIFDEYARFFGVEFKEDGNFSGTTFSQAANFESTSFRGAASFEDVTFSGKAEFDKAKFRGNAAFNGGKFKNTTSFNGATVKGEAGFGKAEFAGRVGFENTQFKGSAWFVKAKFGAYVTFDSASFGPNAKFEETEFNDDAAFNNAVFRQGAEFPWAKFHGSSWWDTVTFLGDALFYKSTFGGEAWFQEATFGGEANFEEVVFQSIFHPERAWFFGRLTLNRNRLGRPTSIAGCYIHQLSYGTHMGERLFFNGCRTLDYVKGTVRDAETGGVLTRPTQVGRRHYLDARGFLSFGSQHCSGLTFLNMYLGRADFTGADISDTPFISCRWNTPREKGYERAYLPDFYVRAMAAKDVQAMQVISNLYKQLSRNLEGRRAFVKAGAFHYRELEVRQKQLKVEGGPLHERLVLFLYRATSEFGENYLRLFLWMVASLVVTTCTISFIENGAMMESWTNKVNSVVLSTPKHLYMTLVGLLPFATAKTVGLDALSPYSTVVIAFEGLILVTLATLFIMALRRRFRR